MFGIFGTTFRFRLISGVYEGKEKEKKRWRKGKHTTASPLAFIVTAVELIHIRFYEQPHLQLLKRFIVLE